MARRKRDRATGRDDARSRQVPVRNQLDRASRRKIIDGQIGSGGFVGELQTGDIGGPLVAAATHDAIRPDLQRGCGGADVERNLLVANVVSGLENEAPADAGVFAGNAARLNGSGHASNFIGLPPGTPVQTWTIGASPAPNTVGGLVNTSISKA